MPCVGGLVLVFAAAISTSPEFPSSFDGTGSAVLHDQPTRLAPPNDAEWFRGRNQAASGDGEPILALPGFAGHLDGPDEVASSTASWFGSSNSDPMHASSACVSRFPRVRSFAIDVRQDYRHYYSCPSLLRSTVMFGFGAVLANTSIDQEFQDAWQRGIGENQAIHQFKYLGEGEYVIPMCAAAMLVGRTFDERLAMHRLGEWGERSTRAFLVGAPPMLLMQFVTGGSRPDEEPYGSRWTPFHDVNGVSGHAFIGAVPWLTAARLTDRPVLKVGFFTLSMMAGASRINDDAHYLSQVMLGWGMGIMAVSAVNETETGRPWRLVPWSVPGGCGFACIWRR